MKKTTITLGSREADFLLAMLGRGIDEATSDLEEGGSWDWPKSVRDRVLNKVAAAYRDTR